MKNFIESSFTKGVVLVGRGFVKLFFITRDIRYAFVDHIWDLFDDRLWVLRFLADV